LLVLTSRNEKCYFAASKGLSDRVFRFPMAEAAVLVESKFLSENLVIDGENFRVTLRFPRGQSEFVETASMHLQAMVLAVRARQEAPVVEETPISDSLAASFGDGNPLDPGAFFIQESPGTKAADERTVLPLPAIG
ncbi:MAG: hypothetical protein ACOYMN_07530, partial [Roseimicrobium sp.]